MLREFVAPAAFAKFQTNNSAAQVGAALVYTDVGSMS
jgi:hypothetical protein